MIFTRTVITRPMRPDVIVKVETVVDGWEISWWEWDGTSRDAVREVHTEWRPTIEEAMARHSEIVIREHS